MFKCKHCGCELQHFMTGWTDPTAEVLGWVCTGNQDSIFHEVTDEGEPNV